MKRIISVIAAVSVLMTAVLMGTTMASAAEPQEFLSKNFNQGEDLWGGATNGSSLKTNTEGVEGSGGGFIYPEFDFYEGFIVYKLEAAAGEKFDTMSFRFTGRLSKSEYYVKVYVSDNDSSGDSHTLVGTQNGTDDNLNWDTAYSIDMSNAVKGKSSVYVKIGMKGLTDKCAVRSFAFEGTYEKADAVALELPYTAEFNAMTPGDDSGWKGQAAEVKNMRTFNDTGAGTNMLCPENSAQAGTVVFKVKAAEGQKLGMLSVKMVGRVFNYPDASDDCYLKVYASKNGSEYTQVYHEKSGTNGNQSQNYVALLASVLKDETEGYVKIEMKSGSNDWVGLKSLSIGVSNSITVPDTQTFTGLRYNDSTWQGKAFSYNFMKIYADEEMFSTLTTDMNITDKGFGEVVYIVKAADGETFEQLHLNLTGRCFDGDGNISRGFSVYTSVDNGASYQLNAKIDANEDPTRGQKYAFDLTEAAKDQSYIMVKLVVNSAFWDWVSIETMTFTQEKGGNTSSEDNTSSQDNISSQDGEDTDGESSGQNNTETGESSPVVPIAMTAVALAAGSLILFRKKFAKIS